jgi:methionyl-tRNA synthetase
VIAFSGVDPFRYYLLADNQFSGDGTFSHEGLVLKNNADLANDWGNLVNRTINMTRKYFPEEVLKTPAKRTHSEEVVASFAKLKPELEEALKRIDPQAYAQACTARSRVLNLYIDKTKPWSLAKTNTPESMNELREVLYTVMEGIRWVATGLTPILPFGMPDVFRQLAIEAPHQQGGIAQLEWGQMSYRPGEPKPIYPRLELAKSET